VSASGPSSQLAVPQLRLRIRDSTTTFFSPTPFEALRPNDMMLALSGERNLTVSQTPSGKAPLSFTFDSVYCDSASGPVANSIGPDDTTDTWERLLATPTIPPLSTFKENTTCRVVYDASESH